MVSETHGCQFGTSKDPPASSQADRSDDDWILVRRLHALECDVDCDANEQWGLAKSAMTIRTPSKLAACCGSKTRILAHELNYYPVIIHSGSGRKEIMKNCIITTSLKHFIR